MSSMTNMDLQALREFANALENFKQSVEVHCSTLEGGISGCSRFMKDASSQKALRDGQQVCMDIRACLNPTEMLLERIRRIIQIMNSMPDFEM